MKKTLLSLGIWALLLVVPRAQADVSVDFFYDNLSGGSWVDVGDYGYCWQPDVAVSNSSWRPYADGYWAYTDLGWTWVSYEDFGWATYHYGRWAMLDGYGWVWVPGRDADLEWGPAWVSWRTGGEYIGWAPLPPETISVVESRPLTGHLDVEFNIGPAYYNFVDVRYIGEPVLRERIIAPTQNITYINQTVNVTNITYKNKTVYNYGPDINVVNRTSSRPIQRLRLNREQNADVATAAKSGGMTKVQGDQLMVAAPMHINRAGQQAAPRTVKTKVDAAKVDHGWSAVGDAKAQAELKERIKGQDLKNVPPPTGASAAGQATTAAGTNPSAVGPNNTSTQSGRGQERGRRGQRETGNVSASPSPAISPGAAASTAQKNGAAGADRGQGRQHDRFPQTTGHSAGGGASTEAGGAAASRGGYAPEEGEQNEREQTGGQRGQQSQQSQHMRGNQHDQSEGAATNNEGQGRQGRRSQGPPQSASQTEEGQAGGRHERGQATRQGGGERQGQGQGQGQERRSEKKGQGEASPEGTPR